MPIYEYHCQNCDKTFETIQHVNDEPLVDCPKCGKPELQKQTSLTSFQLKGSGWYRDGYGGKSSSANNATTSKPSPEKKAETTSSAA